MIDDHSNDANYSSLLSRGGPIKTSESYSSTVAVIYAQIDLINLLNTETSVRKFLYHAIPSSSSCLYGAVGSNTDVMVRVYTLQCVIAHCDGGG